MMIDNGDDDNDNDEKTDVVRHNMRELLYCKISVLNGVTIRLTYV